MVAIEDTRNSTSRLPVAEFLPAAAPMDIPHGLIRAIWATGAAIALVLLALIGASGGLIGSAHSAAARRAAAAPALLSTTSSNPRQTTYAVAAKSFGITIATDRTTWVQVKATGGGAGFSGVLAAGTTKHFDESSPTAIDVGAGGSVIDVEAGTLHQALNPPVAPFTVVLQPQ